MAINGENRIPLRDLTDARFNELYATDRFTASVLSSRMRYIVKHMCTGLLNNAFSLILRDWYDFAATISGPPELDYPMSTVSDSLVLFLGTMAEAVRNTVTEFGPEALRPGDVIAVNDPYRTGNHVNDVCFIRPVFHQGRIIAFVTIRAHQLDMGGVVPAGFSGSKKNVYETGLVIPPMLLYRGDKPVKSTFNLIFDNARFCALLLPDIKSLYQSLLLGERLLLESVERYGAEALLGAIRYSCDVSADAMREAIHTKIPDGVYEAEESVDADGIDASREYRIKLRIAKHGENIEFDLSGTSAQARSSINCGVLDVKTAIGVALKMLIEQDTPYTSGSYRNIDVVLPPGTICSAAPPDGAIFLYWESSIPVLSAVYRALERALGPDAVGGDYGSLMIHNANGVWPNGVPWVTAAQCGGEHGPWSGTKVADGDSYTVFYLANNIDPATEAIESDIPAVVLRKEYATDTAGPGTNRGGAAVMKDTLWLLDAEHWSMPLHAKVACGFGVYGGRDGTAQANWVFPPETFPKVRANGALPVERDIYRESVPVCGLLDPETKTLDPNGQYFYFAYQTAGGGGWGNPMARDPERVLRDVRDEYVSIEGARRDYGVVVIGDPVHDPEGLRIDHEATRHLRAQASGEGRA
jgi:N-methylhydantoinase B